MNNKQRRTLEQMFGRPAPPGLRWTDVASLLGAVGVTVTERSGSRVLLKKGAERIVVHRPHPGPETGRATVRDIAAFPGGDRSEADMMKYKNYLAEVEVDESVGLLHGRVVNSGPYPIATFEAENVEGLRREFELSVDEYLLSCQEDGVEPRKPFSGKLNVRLGTALHQQVAAAASTDGISLNSWIVRALEERARG